ncbi:unnamed protein product [Closterium sp. NIES-64]|nr:unnamed protein product [Closterium sp. NIES-64]
MGLETPQELEHAGSREASGHPALGAGPSANQSGGEAPHPANAEAKAEMDADEAAREKQRRKQSSTGQVMEVPPMDEYLCPISGDVMEEPVTIASGHTFDLKSIQRFFDASLSHPVPPLCIPPFPSPPLFRATRAEGNKHCPVTQEALDNLEMTRNEDMARSIDEWRARNTVMRIQAARPKLQSAKEEEVEGGLLELFQLCEERATNRYWVAAEGLIPVVVNLLKSTSRNLRRKTLATLANLANGNDENKELVVDAGAIQLAVRSLSRDVGESRQAVALLLELSKSPKVCEEIGRAQGSILLLVTMLNNENANAAKDAAAVLQQLASNDQNVVQMAEANHFKPLADRLTTGPSGLEWLFTTVRGSPPHGPGQGRAAAPQLTPHHLHAHMTRSVVATAHSPLRPATSYLLSTPTSLPCPTPRRAGSDMTRIVMASALSRMSLTDQSKAVLVQQGAIPPLVTMIAAGKLEAKAAALGALQNLSSLAANRNELIRAGVVPPLLTLLFSVTSVVMSLKEGAAAILANISLAAGAQAETRIDGNGAILESEETIFQLLSLMNLAGPNIQVNLLKALLGMASVPQAMEVRNRMIVGGAVDVLIPFIDGSEGGPATRPLAARVLRELSKEAEAGRSVAGSLMENQAAALKAIIAMLHDKDSFDNRAAAAGLIAALPPTDTKLNQALVQVGALVQADVVQTLVTMLGMKGGGVGTNAQLKDAALEGAANALVRFTLPSKYASLPAPYMPPPIKQQQQLAELGAIPQLVTLLVTGNAGAKRGAALCLGNFSESSPTLSVSVKAKSGGCCFKAPEEPKCVVHGGTCSVRASFCLLEAEAIDPLVGAMGEKDPLTAEAALTALSTLMADSCRWEASVKIIHESGGFGRVVQQLSEGTERAKEKGVWMLEKLFRLEEYKFEYATKAQGALIEMTQHGSNETKPVAAKILSHLELLHQQSSYF